MPTLPCSTATNTAPGPGGSTVVSADPSSSGGGGGGAAAAAAAEQQQHQPPTHSGLSRVGIKRLSWKNGRRMLLSASRSDSQAAAEGKEDQGHRVQTDEKDCPNHLILALLRAERCFHDGDPGVVQDLPHGSQGGPDRQRGLRRRRLVLGRRQRRGQDSLGRQQQQQRRRRRQGWTWPRRRHRDRVGGRALRFRHGN